MKENNFLTSGGRPWLSLAPNFCLSLDCGNGELFWFCFVFEELYQLYLYFAPVARFPM